MSINRFDSEAIKEYVITRLDDISDKLEDIINDIINAKFLHDGTQTISEPTDTPDIDFRMGKVYYGEYGLIKEKVEDIKKEIEGQKSWFDGKVTGFEEAENNNKDIIDSIPGGTTQDPGIGQGGGNGDSEDVSVGDEDNTSLGGEDQDSDSTDVDNIDKEEEDPNLNDEVPKVQITEVIALIYGTEISISEEERKIIIEAIKNINETELLEEIDVDIANRIIAKIIKEYIDKKLELEGITKEELQEYIESQPSIKIEFEIDKALKSFESLIESEILTEEQIKTIIDEKINIYSTDEEFMEAYINAGGTETDITNIESFFDTETNEVHIRDTVDSKVIINSIICIIGEELLLDEEIGQVLNPSNTDEEHTKVDVEVDEDSKIDMSDESNKDSSYNQVENIEETDTIELGDINIGNSEEDAEIDVDKN